jgi:hypothetical protein
VQNSEQISYASVLVAHGTVLLEQNREISGMKASYGFHIILMLQQLSRHMQQNVKMLQLGCSVLEELVNNNPHLSFSFAGYARLQFFLSLALEPHRLICTKLSSYHITEWQNDCPRLPKR